MSEAGTRRAYRPMKAIVIERYGDNRVLQYRDVPKPTPAAGEILVRVHAAGLNPIDYKTRSGKAKAILPYRFPLVLGNELAGEVVECGPDTERFQPGQRVFARMGRGRIGSFAEYAVVREEVCAHIPAGVSYETAAAVPLAGLTAYQALVERGNIDRGMNVLIHAGAGGVGSLAIQLAKLRGAVVATTASAPNHDLLRSLGADICIDYRTEDFRGKVSGIDYVLDTLGGKTLEHSFEIVKPGGHIISIAGLPDEASALSLGLAWPLRLALRFLTRRVRAAARRTGVRYEYLFMHADGEQLAELAGLLAENKLTPLIDRRVPLSNAAEAFAYVEQGHARGKVILTVTA